MLSLAARLGVTTSPQAPFPTDYVTLPVSANHRRIGSLPLAAEEGTLRYCNVNSSGALHSKHAQATHLHTGGLRWLGVLYVMSVTQILFASSTSKLRLTRFGANTDGLPAA